MRKPLHKPQLIVSRAISSAPTFAFSTNAYPLMSAKSTLTCAKPKKKRKPGAKPVKKKPNACAAQLVSFEGKMHVQICRGSRDKTPTRIPVTSPREAKQVADAALTKCRVKK